MATQHSIQQQELRFALFLGGLVGVSLLVVGLLKLAPHPGAPSAAGNLLLVQTRGAAPAPGVTAAPVADLRQIDQRLLAASATTGGELEVSLVWNSLSDLDLELREPSGELITAYHRQSASGGVQDVDANPTLVSAEGERRIAAGERPGAENLLPVPEFLVDMDKQVGLPGLTLPESGEKAPSRFTRTPVEHIYFTHAPKGFYTVYAHCYSWRESGAAPLPYTIQVRSRGQVFHQTSGTIGPASFVADGVAPLEVCRFQAR